ncbi:MAG: class I SAM-dependent methyltransferase [Bacteroidetes bacterium]|nr:class I SAM-dependent methyltransferase [Bacteroidota bacterium]
MSWYKHWFADELYMDLYAHRDAAEARQAIDLFERVTGTISGGSRSPLLDLACGTGRHAFELARRGYTVMAADLSPTLLSAAARKTQRYRDRLSLVRADMRRLPFGACFAAVLQLFTAFGYFRTDAANEAVVAGVRAVLPTDGWYMLDFLNAADVARTLEARTEQHTAHGRVVQERAIRNGRVEKRIRISGDGREEEFTESVRLYTLADFNGMFSRNGFAMAEVFGSYEGAVFRDTSPRCIMFARTV